MNDAERSARRAKAVRAIGRAVVGEDAADPDAVAAKPPEGPTDERVATYEVRVDDGVVSVRV